MLWLQHIEQTSISDASFTGNVAGDKKTIQTDSPIDWDCRLGSWMASQGAFEGDFSAPECYPCSAGYYGNRSGLTDPTCDNPCDKGYFCTFVPRAQRNRSRVRRLSTCP